MQKEISFIIKLLVISFLIALPLVSALTITFSAPETVEIDEEFTVTISADSEEIHDVKIFVHTSEDEKISRSEYISDIYHDGAWLDSWFYIKEAFPDEREYKIKIFESSGEREICVRLRKTSTQTASIECQKIEVLEKGKIEEPMKEENKETIIETGKTQTEEKNNIKLLSAAPAESNERIYLNQKSEEKEVQTKQNKFRSRIIYSFLLVLTAVIILLALRRL